MAGHPAVLRHGLRLPSLNAVASEDKIEAVRNLTAKLTVMLTDDELELLTTMEKDYGPDAVNELAEASNTHVTEQLMRFAARYLRMLGVPQKMLDTGAAIVIYAIIGMIEWDNSNGDFGVANATKAFMKRFPALAVTSATARLSAIDQTSFLKAFFPTSLGGASLQLASFPVAVAALEDAMQEYERGSTHG